MREKATSQQANEILAFELAFWLHQNGPEAGTTMDRAAFAAEWRNKAALRERSRLSVQALALSLENAGINVQHVQDSKLVLKALKELLTIPAQTAYELPVADAPFAQGDS